MDQPGFSTSDDYYIELPAEEVNAIVIEREHWGIANFFTSRGHRNPVLIYQFRSDPTKCYQFFHQLRSIIQISFNHIFHQLRHKSTGYHTFSCYSCRKLKNEQKLSCKVPSIIVGDNHILVDPEHPINGHHFCNGELTNEVALTRSRFEVLEMAGNVNIEEDEVTDRLNNVGDDPVYLSLLTPNDQQIFKDSIELRKKEILSFARKTRKRAHKTTKTNELSDYWTCKETEDDMESSTALRLNEQISTVYIPSADIPSIPNEDDSKIYYVNGRPYRLVDDEDEGDDIVSGDKEEDNEVESFIVHPQDIDYYPELVVNEEIVIQSD